MNRCTLSLSLLLTVLPGFTFAATDRREESKRQADLDAGMLYLLGTAMTANKHLAPVGDVVCKTGAKEVIDNHLTPDAFRDMHVDVPGLGAVTVVDSDQFGELAYELGRLIVNGELGAQDKVVKALTLTAAREKIVQFISYVYSSLCGGATPQVAKDDRVVRTAVKECIRYMVDGMLREGKLNVPLVGSMMHPK